MVNFMELIQQLSPFETPKINHVQRGFITDVRAQTLILILNRKVGNCLDVNSTILRTKNVCITEKGRELLEKLADYENERVNRIMQTLSVEELTDLTLALDKVRAVLGEDYAYRRQRQKQ
jgi:hypothetical protein